MPTLRSTSGVTRRSVRRRWRCGYLLHRVHGLALATVLRGCNPDYNIAQAGIITRWTPVKNLTFSADLTYSHLDQKMSGLVAYPGSSAFGKPAAVYELKDQDNLLLLLRAQRNW